MKKRRDIVRLRRWCIRRKGEGASVSEICTAAQIPRRNFYNWWSRYRQYGLDGLTPRSKRPQTIHRTPTRTVDKIKTLRLKTGWCSRKIAGYLRMQGRPVGHMTVYRVLCSAGLNRPLQTQQDQAYPRRNRQTHHTRQDRTLVPNLRPRTCEIPAPLNVCERAKA